MIGEATYGDGKRDGLLLAAETIEAAANKDVLVRIITGKKEQALRAVNEKLLRTVAGIIRRMAEGEASGTNNA